ncbi:MAG: hypothetical protein U9R74_15295 [Pseudomonadota bacterium]|nr:hypothetical protein [Pseudomonadota bacterium]
MEIEKAYGISIVGLPGQPPVFSDGGQFVIDSLPKEACALEVIRLGTSDSELQTLCQRVMIEAGKPTPVVVDQT